MKKITGGIIILHLCTKNCNHMMYRQREFFVILVIFCSFTLPPNDPENQNFEKIKKMPGDIYPVIHTCVP